MKRFIIIRTIYGIIANGHFNNFKGIILIVSPNESVGVYLNYTR